MLIDNFDDTFLEIPAGRHCASAVFTQVEAIVSRKPHPTEIGGILSPEKRSEWEAANVGEALFQSKLYDSDSLLRLLGH